MNSDAAPCGQETEDYESTLSGLSDFLRELCFVESSKRGYVCSVYS